MNGSPTNVAPTIRTIDGNLGITRAVTTRTSLARRRTKASSTVDAETRTRRDVDPPVPHPERLDSRSVRHGFGSEPISSSGTSWSGSAVGFDSAAITWSADAMPIALPDVWGTALMALRRASSA